jgi:hypothetical protein
VITNFHQRHFMKRIICITDFSNILGMSFDFH